MLAYIACPMDLVTEERDRESLRSLVAAVMEHLGMGIAGFSPLMAWGGQRPKDAQGRAAMATTNLAVLGQADFLIVLCLPTNAVSVGCMMELGYFLRQTGRAGRVILLDSVGVVATRTMLLAAENLVHVQSESALTAAVGRLNLDVE